MLQLEIFLSCMLSCAHDTDQFFPKVTVIKGDGEINSTVLSLHIIKTMDNGNLPRKHVVPDRKKNHEKQCFTGCRSTDVDYGSIMDDS